MGLPGTRRQRLDNRRDRDALPRAVQLLEQAVARDPRFAA